MSKTAAFFPRLRAWGPSIFIMGIIFAFSSIPAQEMPSFGLLDFLVKKGGHATGYALLALANVHALQLVEGTHKPSGDKVRPYLMAFLMAVLYSATDELHQSFVPGRHPAVMDVGIDGIGAILGLLLRAWYRPKNKKHNT